MPNTLPERLGETNENVSMEELQQELQYLLEEENLQHGLTKSNDVQLTTHGVEALITVGTTDYYFTLKVGAKQENGYAVEIYHKAREKKMEYTKTGLENEVIDQNKIGSEFTSYINDVIQGKKNDGNQSGVILNEVVESKIENKLHIIDKWIDYNYHTEAQNKKVKVEEPYEKKDEIILPMRWDGKDTTFSLSKERGLLGFFGGTDIMLDEKVVNTNNESKSEIIEKIYDIIVASLGGSIGEISESLIYGKIIKGLNMLQNI